MAGDAGAVEIVFRAKLDQLDKDMDQARSKAARAGEEMGAEMDRRLGAKLAGAGKTLTRTLTPAAAAVGGAFGLAFREFDSGSDILISKTGASGKALDSLEGSMKKVAGGVTSGFGDIGSVVGDLNTALGITGKPLEDLAGRIVKLQELGESFDTTSFTRFLGDWSISSDDAGGALDRLYKIGQVTGIGVGQLMDLTVQFGAPMRALGFSVDDSTALIAKFSKEGVNTEAVLAGMKVGLGKMAKAGEEPAATFQRLVGEIKGAATEGDAFAIAAEAFGSRAGPDLAMAIREGRFELGDLQASLAGSAGSINETHKATIDWSDKLEMLKNRVIGVIGPVGEYGMAFAGIAAGVGPVLTGVGKLIGLFGGHAAAATASAAGSTAAGTAAAASSGGFFAAAAGIWAVVWPILAVIAVLALIAGAVYLVVRNWDTIVAATGAAWDWVYDKVSSVVSAIGGFLGNLIGWVVDFVAEWGILLLGPIGAAWKFRDEIWGVVQAVLGFLGRLVSGAIDKGGELISWAAGLPGRILGAIGNLGSLLWNAGADVVRGLINGIGSMGSALWSSVTSFISRNIPGPVKRVLGIGSPSKVAYGLMLDVGAGMVGGLGASERMVARAAGSLGETVLTQPSVMDLAVRSHDAAMGDLGRMGSGGGTGGDSGAIAGGPTYIIQGSLVAERDVSTLVRGGIANVGRHNNGPGF